MARQINNGFGMGRSQFLSCISRGVLLPRIFVDNNSIRHFGEVRLRKSTEVMNVQRRNVD
jgi:hypothetical protein